MKIGPNLNINYAWPLGFNGWNIGNDDNLLKIDTLMQLCVEGVETAPPASPTDGQRFIIGPSATGAWADKTNQIALWLEKDWQYFMPSNGWLVWDRKNSQKRLLVFETGWKVLIAPTPLINAF